MPHIEIHVLEGVFDAGDKQRILTSVMRAFGEAAGGRIYENTAVRIIEVPSGNWGFAGQILRTDDGLRIKSATG